MGSTIIEKILASHSGRTTVSPGDLVECDVDVAVQLDIVFAAAGGAQPLPLRVADPSRVCVVMDHSVPANSIGDAIGQQRAREFVERFGIERFYDVGRHGIAHQVILEQGIARPGEILVCADSHTLASGVFNCAARALGALEVLQVVCTGKTWFTVSPTVLIELTGELHPTVYGKDVLLYIAGLYGSFEGHNLEFAGPGLSTMGLDDRAALATMCAEVSANFATFPADELIEQHLTARGITLTPVEADPTAEYVSHVQIDLTKIRPQLARPGSVPRNTEPVANSPRTPINQAFIGSCANGKLSDIAVAAELLRGRSVAEGVRLVVTPASQAVYLEAIRRGYVEVLVEAGAVVTTPTCGACFGGHTGIVGPGEVCVTSSTRNFKGRMGSPDAEIYLASSATVAASAVTGYICEASSLRGRAS